MIKTHKAVLFSVSRLPLQISVKVDNWNTEELANKVDLKQYKYFYFITVEREEVRNPHNIEQLTVYAKNCDQSNNYFINAYIETQEDIEAKKEIELLNIMKDLKWNKIVRGINQNWTYEFKDGDTIVNFKGKII